MGWKKHSSRTIYENDWMRVLEDEVTNPGGGRNLYGHIRFKNVAVAVLPIDSDGNTRLVGQSRYTLSEYSWELPMGGAPKEQDPLAAAKRELQEETGLTAKHWREMCRLHTSNSITDERAIVYAATGLQQGLSDHEETEDITVKTLPLEAAIEMALAGEITDAISVVALLRAGLDQTMPAEDEN